MNVGCCHDFGCGVLRRRVVGQRASDSDAADQDCDCGGRRKSHGPRASTVTTLGRSEEHTSELQSLMRISYAVFCFKKKSKALYNTYNSISTLNTTSETN